MNGEDAFSSGVYQKRPLEIVRGKGSIVFDKNGKEYIDCVGGVGTAIVGHSNEYVINALTRQLDKISIVPEIFYSDIRSEYLTKLSQVFPSHLSKFFLSNSGTESVECALKTARKFTGRKEIIFMKNSFHGRTMGSLSATYNAKYRKSFEPLVPEFASIEFNNIEEINKITENTGAVILELVQGESGVNLIEKQFLQALREQCNKTNSLLIFDEVQTGLGRTGKMFALEHFNVMPDILCAGKGIGGGIPMGVTAAKQEIFASLLPGEHGNTMGGNPLVCAGSLATLDFIEKNNLPQNAERIGKYFLENFEKVESVREIRGIGLMIGIESRFKVKEYVLKAIEKGVLLHTAGTNTIRLLPPLTITQQEMDKVIEVINEVIQ